MRAAHALVIALVAMTSACQFSIRGTAMPADDAAPPAPAQDGFAAVDLAARLDLGAGPADLSTPPAHVGDACSGACASGLTCMTWVPAGYCSRACGSAADCPQGSSCVEVSGGAQYCLVDDTSGCARPDLTCIDCGASVCGPPSLCDPC